MPKIIADQQICMLYYLFLYSQFTLYRHVFLAIKLVFYNKNCIEVIFLVFKRIRMLVFFSPSPSCSCYSCSFYSFSSFSFSSSISSFPFPSSASFFLLYFLIPLLFFLLLPSIISSVLMIEFRV